MMTYVKQYTLLELVMLNYLIQMDINQCKNIQQFLVIVAWYVAVLYQSFFQKYLISEKYLVCEKSKIILDKPLFSDKCLLCFFDNE